MLTCGMIEYINALPFLGPFLLGALKSDVKFVTGPPRDLNRLMEERKLPVSLMSASFFLKNKNQFDLISGLGIGAKYKVLSVCLFYPEFLNSFDGVTVALDPESDSSNTLIKWYLTKIKKQNPHFIIPKNISEGPFNTAFLLIGDRCLAFGEPKGYKVIDIGEEWMNITGLPLPFAVLAAQKEWLANNAEEAESLKQDLLSALSWSLDHREELIDLAKKQTHLEKNQIINYWNHLAYVLDHRYKQALEYMEKNVL